MSTTPEGKVKAQVKKVLNHYGCYHEWPVPYGYGKSGLDCTGLLNGVPFYIETKAPGQHLTARQEATRADIQAAGGTVFVIGERMIKGRPTGLKDLVEFLECIRQLP
jgi:hypothetical protein